MNLEEAIKSGARIQTVSEPPRVVEIDDGNDPVIFDLNDIVTISSVYKGSATTFSLKTGVRCRLEIPYEKFKKMIGARPQRLEIPDEEGS